MFTITYRDHTPMGRIISLTILLICGAFMVSTGQNQTIISDGDTIVSDDGENFLLGFFSPANSSTNRYLGILYNKITIRTVVWVANRQAPLTDSSGRLELSGDGNLRLLNGNNTVIWSTNSSTSSARNPLAQLLDTGNLVIRNENDRDPDNYLWQSFDYLGNTLLPGMKMGRDFVKGIDKYLVSWASSDDPSPGEYTNWLDINGYPQLLLRRGPAVVLNSGPWNGLRFSGLPSLRSNLVYTFEFVMNQREAFYKFELVNSSVYSRMVLEPSGNVERFIWINRTQEWGIYLTAQMDNCDRYRLCGPYGSCNINDSPSCGCLRGFQPRFPERWNVADWYDGCLRRTPLDCENGDGFVRQSGIKLPDTRGSWFNESMSLEECETMCLRDCNCTAYANTDVRGGGSGCLLWFNDLIDIREYTDGQDIYIRMAASELDGGNRAKRRLIIIVMPVILTVVVLAGLCLLLVIKRRKQKKKGIIEVNHGIIPENTDQNEDWELPLFDFDTIAKATNDFLDKNKLGEGGFGPVYKGVLKEGERRQEIAVKRHSKKSNQGLHEFKSEVSCVAKLQHRNLVKLLGCCIEEGERMLIYEYMPNKSLNPFIFEEEKRKSLDWFKRNNIINGIARGILYLHQDSRLRIIHRDLKASNILLDNEMNPRISDFGLARSLEGNDTEANTKRVVGTYGYMAPEYAIDGIFSTKSDVFSFGVLVLEIMSGMKNRGFHHVDHSHNLLGHAWRLYQNGKLAELIDSEMWASCKQYEAYRTIHIGLLCVQRYPEHRPSMATVILMLTSDMELPNPKEPGFFTERRIIQEQDHSSSSANQLTFTSMAPR